MYSRSTLESLLIQSKPEIPISAVEHYPDKLNLTRTRESLCGFVHMFKTFIRLAESRSSAVNKWSKCERCFIIVYTCTRAILMFSLALLEACFSVFHDCSCISCWALFELLQYFPNMIVGSSS